MNRAPTLLELFSYETWAMSRLFDIALALPDEQLDREFEIGPGSIRATFIHIFAANTVWFARTQDGRSAKAPNIADRFPLSGLRVRWSETLAKWNEFIESIDNDSDLDRSIEYNDMRGTPHESRLLDILLHVVNHGTYHRAQILNMLRHVRATPPRIDYIFRKHETAPVLSVNVLQYFYACSDWMRDRVLNACAKLNDSQLDHPFEMGIGTIRNTLDHMAIAEEWWLASWRGKAIVGFPSPSGTSSVEQIRERLDAVADARVRILNDPSIDLAKQIEGKPSADRTILFPIGVTMIQLCLHGTHHRAQVVNMLRHLGFEPPKTDLILMTRKSV